MSKNTDLDVANRRTARSLLLVAVGMFGFGFALVPIYDVFCDITGLNGKTGTVSAQTLDAEVDTSRWVTVQFVANINSQLNWEFRPQQNTMKVNPGGLYEARFVATNLSAVATVGQAVPSLAPSLASIYFNKTECFCFTQQKLERGESRSMPIRFVIDKALPKGISTVTLAYTFFKVDPNG